MNESKLSDLKIGDLVYAQNRTFQNYQIAKIIRIGKMRLTVDEDGRERQIDIQSGYQTGSRGTGRFGSFDSVYWYPMTDKVKFQIKVNKVCNDLENFKFDKLKSKITKNEDLGKIKEFVDFVQSLLKTEPEKQ